MKNVYKLIINTHIFIFFIFYMQFINNFIFLS